MASSRRDTPDGSGKAMWRQEAFNAVKMGAVILGSSQIGANDGQKGKLRPCLRVKKRNAFDLSTKNPCLAAWRTVRDDHTSHLLSREYGEIVSHARGEVKGRGICGENVRGMLLNCNKIVIK